jgi:hypothetical protein
LMLTLSWWCPSTHLGRSSRTPRLKGGSPSGCSRWWDRT